jgi:hypothetical protein
MAIAHQPVRTGLARISVYHKASFDAIAIRRL